MTGGEVVLLVESDEGRQKLRAVQVDHRYVINMFLERCHLDPSNPSKVWIRKWVNKNGERALTGQRIFREDTPLPTPEPSENPVFDELKIKKPLPFTIQDAKK